MPSSRSQNTPAGPIHAVPPTMTAVVAETYGDADVVSTATINTPVPEPHEVLVEVRAAGLDRGVVHLLNGLPYIVRLIGFGFRRPKQPILGSEVSGVVVALGSEVHKFTIGQRVFGVGSGTFAEYAVVPEDRLSNVPESISFEQAASSAISGVTALQALSDIGEVEACQSVLIIGASGGVGSFATQLAVHLGARVTAVASAAKAEGVRALGAETVLDYRTSDYLKPSAGYDLIIDIGGLNPIRSLRDALTPRGKLVIVGGEGGSKLTGGVERNLRAAALSVWSSRKLMAFISEDHHSNTDRIAALLEQGALSPAISHRFTFAEAANAIERLCRGEVSGKAVLVPAFDVG